VSTAGARLVLGERAAEVRRSLGPTSWAALEVLTTHAPNGACVVASVRFVADELGVAKNTAHRAMRRLVDAGLAAPMQERSTDGRFVAGTYRLAIDPDVIRVEPVDSALVTSTRPARARHTRARVDVGTQLDLLASCD
jgi:DNA-binding IscR family transcriptional regulator